MGHCLMFRRAAAAEIPHHTEWKLWVGIPTVAERPGAVSRHLSDSGPS